MSQRQKFRKFFKLLPRFLCLNVREFRQKSIGEGFKCIKWVLHILYNTATTILIWGNFNCQDVFRIFKNSLFRRHVYYNQLIIKVISRSSLQEIPRTLPKNTERRGKEKTDRDGAQPGKTSFYNHTWKKPMSPPMVHFEVCVAAANIWAFLHRFVRRCPNFWAFLRSFAHCRLKNWISVGDWINWLFPCMCITK